MDDNCRIAIGYICVALVLSVVFIGGAWIMSPQEFTFKIEMDNNTKEAIESVNYTAISQAGKNNSQTIKEPTKKTFSFGNPECMVHESYARLAMEHRLNQSCHNVIQNDSGCFVYYGCGDALVATGETEEKE